MSISRIDGFLHELQEQKFFGSVELKFEAGRIVLLRKTETLKPLDKTCRNSRGEARGQQESL